WRRSLASKCYPCCLPALRQLMFPSAVPASLAAKTPENTQACERISHHLHPLTGGFAIPRPILRSPNALPTGNTLVNSPGSLLSRLFLSALVRSPTNPVVDPMAHRAAMFAHVASSSPRLNQSPFTIKGPVCPGPLDTAGPACMWLACS